MSDKISQMKRFVFLFLFSLLAANAYGASLYLTGQVPQKLKFLWKSGQMYLETNNNTPIRIHIYKKKSRDIASTSQSSYVVTQGELFKEEDLKNVEKIVIEAP
jgi:hypothetical protein